MKKKILTCLLVISISLMMVPQVTIAYSQPTAQRYDFECTDIKLLTDEIREENPFKIGVTFNYYAINNGHWYTPPDEWIECHDCGGDGINMCSACGGSGGKLDWVTVYCSLGGHSPSGSKPCRPECDGWDYECNVCGQPFSNNYGGYQYCSCGGTVTQAHRCDCVYKEMRYVTCPYCNGSGATKCPVCGGEGGHWEPQPPVWIPPTRPSLGFTQVEFLIDNKIQAEVTQPLTITIDNEVKSTSSEGTGWEVWGSIYLEIELNAGENIGDKNVEARINWDYRNREINASNNKKNINISVIPATNLQVELIPPNAPYRTDTEVVTTFKILNKDDIGELNIRPKHNLTAEFKAIHPITGEIIASDKVGGIVIPKQGSNIVYYKWHVPVDYDEDKIQLQCDINTTKGVNETNYSDNTYVGVHDVQKFRVQETPDTTFEKRRPPDFNEPTGHELVVIVPFANEIKERCSYEQWEWKNNWYVKKTYGLELSSLSEVTPDINSPSYEYLHGINKWQIKSGYGFSINLLTSTSSNGFSSMPESAYSSVQRSAAFFPEFNYATQSKRYRNLDHVALNNFEFYQNEHTITNKGLQDFRRVHFTPLWYPDGEYIVKTYSYDCWTPAGMLSVLNEAPPIQIKGNMYDDWYVTHSEKKD